MATLGYTVLLATFVVCSYAAAISVAGARRGSRRLVESGIGAFHMVTALMVMASVLMVRAFVTDDFSIRYVSRYSDSVQPLFFKITSYWGGLDGSIMFWVFLLACFGSIAVHVNRDRHRELIPYVVAVIAGVQMFFLFLMIIHNNPFNTYLTQVPADGNGLNPLLQNFYMVIHPPTMYSGFVGLTIPYAFGMAALISGHLDDSWLRAVRRWTMIAWLFLSIGLGLGMIWAYEELGWGGYWMWDPVENAGLLPWFTATAFLHSVMVQERRGMLRVWNVSLVIMTFFLTLFGTFMTRSGIVQSVHSFGQDPVLTRLFTGFMVSMLIFSFGFVIYRMPLLQARNELDSWVSREAAFLYNNWILLFSAFFVLFATMFPTLSEAITGQRITVAAPFFNQWMVPIGLIMLLLTGIGPLLAWRRSTVDNLRTQFLLPTISGLVLGGTVVALGIPFWSAGLCFAFSGFVVGTIAQEFWRGARVRQQTSGTDMFTALVGLVGRNKRRYGGYLVHVGIVLMFLGFAGSDMKKHETLVMKPGQVAHVGGYDIRHDRIRVTDDGRKQMVSAELTILKDGGELTKMYPARWFFRKHEDQPTTEVAIRRTLAEDLYIVMPQFEAAQQTANIEITVTPLVNWLWLGFGVLALGTLIAVLPETAFAFAAARVPEGVKAATASMILLAIVAPAAVQAQDGGVVAKSPQQRQLEQKIICMCGSSGCVHSTLENCPMRPVCHGHTAQTGEIQSLLNDGKGVDQVLASFVEKYGEAVLAVPRNTGFNALAWVLPYALGALGLVMILVTARRWSRPAAAVAGGGDAQIDPGLDARLDDELRNLD